MTNITHGYWKTKTYRAWQSMKQRCYNPNAAGFHRYGGRGLTVCERWLHSFENFLADMGVCPPGLTLDRIKNEMGYFPENCRWATWEEQMSNFTKIGRPQLSEEKLSKGFSLYLEGFSLKQAAAIAGISKTSLWREVKRSTLD